MDRPTSGAVEPRSSAARWLAISTGVVVLLALPTVFVLAAPRSGELGGLNIVPAVALLVFEVSIWWKPVARSVASRTATPSILFCLGAMLSQVPAVVVSVTDLVIDSYPAVVSMLAIKALVAIGTLVLQAPHRP